MATKSERFLAAFGAIERYLRTLTGMEKHTRFYKLVDRGAELSAGVRRYSDDLKEFADLRNAIVHERTDGRVLAEPNETAVREIEALQAALENPPRVIPRFARPVVAMSPLDRLASAAYVMLQHDFSQIPIRDDDGFVALLTANDIARWLGRCAPQYTLYLEETLIAEILACDCKPDTPGGMDYAFFAQDATIFAVLDAFRAREHSGLPLEAILITEHGDPREALLGIITIWDLPLIYASQG